MPEGIAIPKRLTEAPWRVHWALLDYPLALPPDMFWTVPASVLADVDVVWLDHVGCWRGERLTCTHLARADRGIRLRSSHCADQAFVTPHDAHPEVIALQQYWREDGAPDGPVIGWWEFRTMGKAHRGARLMVKYLCGEG